MLAAMKWKSAFSAGLIFTATLACTGWSSGQAQDLMKGNPLDAFRPVAAWRGVGAVSQEDATTTGPTRSAPFECEANSGPTEIQADHGPVAIRKILINPLPDPDAARLAELDAYWAEVSRSVNTGDFAAYQAGCHEKAVLVSGSKRVSYPLSQALARWKKEFDDTKVGTRKSTVEFRFAHRYGDATTAHESGMFRYTWKLGDGEAKPEYVEFEALLLKENGIWKILMEYQRATASKAEWDALAPGD